MTLQQLIEKLENLKSEHGEDVTVEFTIPAHENSYEPDYDATELATAIAYESTLRNDSRTFLELTLV